ncbi:putative glycosyltransferase, exosortase G system-associated [Oscillochloris sp. ZM17-4]|uniref:TIGR03111 family XrtG-associated glycosyltransferase n=1 Tax=Oscillochloris sp. ZM17-4 TaxID=2866714 RepID=UPI001C729E7F|nr:TIGR03111 family XrtG-associated glycosyltransferase [Oscillochloris sp. ZM17-4]MBX0329055.1 putative glycosyltransferase, exosortase G system-associated [Oscillochloris sp. ZM17-4]
MSDLITNLIFWGVWLLAPMLVDGLTTLASLVGTLAQRRRRRYPALAHFPLVTIIVPVYNSADTLETCLRSIAAQTYPTGQIDVLLIDNGTSDDSFAIFSRVHGELRLAMHWHTLIGRGKSRALNAGIHMARGQYICNLDSDAALAPDAIAQIVTVMEADPQLAAGTGAIQVLEPEPGAPPIPRLLGECEFLEYLTAFNVGRTYQTLQQNLYTLSGAFSFFRRSVLLRTLLYSQETVTEDTDLTFQLYEVLTDERISCITEAIAYVHPIESLARLYAQRVRWQRGQLEVSARYTRLMRRPFWQPFGFVPSRVLLVDHTLAFPRLIWTMLLPVLIGFGYSSALIVSALLVLYGFYLLVEVGWVAVALIGVDAASQRRLLRTLWLLPIMPLYRMGIFWFRLSGFIHATAEPGTWSVTDPLSQVRDGIADLRRRLR